MFEPLTKLVTIALIGNPGFDTFKPVADAGPGGTLTAGETVTLGGPGTSGGPWGSNVTHAWTQTDGDDMAATHGDAVGDGCREVGLHRAGAGGGDGRQAEA